MYDGKGSEFDEMWCLGFWLSMIVNVFFIAGVCSWKGVTVDMVDMTEASRLCGSIEKLEGVRAPYRAARGVICVDGREFEYSSDRD
jgi:hypothetical protein